jgi:hypothetical protein
MPTTALSARLHSTLVHAGQVHRDCQYVRKRAQRSYLYNCDPLWLEHLGGCTWRRNVIGFPCRVA